MEVKPPPSVDKTFNPSRDFNSIASKQSEPLKVPISQEPRTFLQKHLPEQTFDKLVQYCDLLHKWNKRKQLVAKGTLEVLWLRHVLDSAQLYPLYPDRPKYKWLDIGSGGGFPGLVLACIATGFASDNEFILVESNGYKAEFLRHVTRNLGLNCVVMQSREEDLRPQKADVVSARAVANLGTLLQWSEKHLAKKGKGIFLKGNMIDQEIEEASLSERFNFTRVPSWTNKSGTILIAERKATPAG